MNPPAVLLLSAAVPEEGGYVNLVKVGAVIVLLLLWASAALWVDRDTDVVKTKREQWNVITLSGGLVGFVVLFIPPWGGALLLVGLFFWLLLAGGAMFAYIVHRNGRVTPEGRVLTRGHLKRLLSAGPGKRKTVKDKGQRVRIADHEGNFVDFPDDSDEALDYNAVQDFFHDLLWRRASDVEVVAGKERYRVVYRIDGVASEHPEGMSPQDGERVFRYLKRLAGLNVQEIRRPQRGRIRAALLSAAEDPGPTQVETSGTTAGERLRVHFQHGPILLRIQELGLAPPRAKMFKEFLSKAKGLVLISGPPHNGLTTTQYAILRAHDAYLQNIHTLERNLVVELDNITQRLYDEHNTDVNFARTLQSMLRREPDVVLVGECKDRETAHVAARAAAEDRKIYLGLHAKDSFDAVSRYLSFVEDNRLAAKGLVGVVNQRLVRVLCTECREAFKPDAATLKKLNLPGDKIDRFFRPPNTPVVDKKGREIICQNCQGAGYVGRTGLFELLFVDPEVRKLIAEGTSINRIKTQCRKSRMFYLQEEGLLKVIDGTTSMNEILRSLRENGQ